MMPLHDAPTSQIELTPDQAAKLAISRNIRIIADAIEVSGASGADVTNGLITVAISRSIVALGLERTAQYFADLALDLAMGELTI